MSISFLQGPQGVAGAMGFNGAKGAMVCFIVLIIWTVVSPYYMDIVYYLLLI